MRKRGTTRRSSCTHHAQCICVYMNYGMLCVCLCVQMWCVLSHLDTSPIEYLSIAYRVYLNRLFIVLPPWVSSSSSSSSTSSSFRLVLIYQRLLILPSPSSFCYSSLFAFFQFLFSILLSTLPNSSNLFYSLPTLFFRLVVFPLFPVLFVTLILWTNLNLHCFYNFLSYFKFSSAFSPPSMGIFMGSFTGSNPHKWIFLYCNVRLKL